MENELDGLSLSLDADFSNLDRAFDDMDKRMGDIAGRVDDTLGQAFDDAGRRMSGAIEDFVRRGEVSFESLRETALDVAGDITSRFLDAGLSELGLDSAVTGGVGSLINGLFGRAQGGPVSAGVPYVVGEEGPELFVPRTPGRVAPGGGAGANNITVNVYGPASGPEIRQSAGQVAAAVATSLKRAQRNL